MKTLMPLLAVSTGLVLAACSAPPSGTTDADAASASADSPPAAAVPAPAATPAPTTDEAIAPQAPTAPAAGEAGQPPSTDAPGAMPVAGAQAGWYSGGMFRTCGSATALKVDNTADIERQIKAGGMAAGEPVYVKLEGMPMSGNVYMLTRVVQVGSSTPVRDCPMVGTTTQIGG